MKDPKKEADRWLKQAENDYLFAKTGFREGFYAQTCFICQQVAEKSVKAIHYFHGARIVIGHSVHQLLKEIDIVKDRKIMESAGLLDQYYIPARYPNGLPGGAPFEVFSQDQAEKALEAAEIILNQAREAIQL